MVMYKIDRGGSKNRILGQTKHRSLGNYHLMSHCGFYSLVAHCAGALTRQDRSGRNDLFPYSAVRALPQTVLEKLKDFRTAALKVVF